MAERHHYSGQEDIESGVSDSPKIVTKGKTTGGFYASKTREGAVFRDAHTFGQGFGPDNHGISEFGSKYLPPDMLQRVKQIKEGRKQSGSRTR